MRAVYPPSLLPSLLLASKVNFGETCDSHVELEMKRVGKVTSSPEFSQCSLGELDKTDSNSS